MLHSDGGVPRPQRRERNEKRCGCGKLSSDAPLTICLYCTVCAKQIHTRHELLNHKGHPTMTMDRKQRVIMEMYKDLNK